MQFTMDTKFGELLDNPAAKAVLVKHLPQIEDPGIKAMLGMARGMSLKTVAGLPQAKMTPEKLQAIMDELSKL